MQFSENDYAPMGFVSVDATLESIRDVIAVKLSPGLVRFLLGMEATVGAVSALTVAAILSQTRGVGVWRD